MAATPWAFYYQAKHKLGLGGNSGFNMSADVFKLALFETAATSPADLQTLSLHSQISNESVGGAYSAGGKSLSNDDWTTTATSVQKFDSDDWVITATGTSITNVLFAAIHNSLSAGGGYLLCFSQLSTSQFPVSTGNTLTVQMNTAGIFTLA
jgi:hypothetical protein